MTAWTSIHLQGSETAILNTLSFALPNRFHFTRVLYSPDPPTLRQYSLLHVCPPSSENWSITHGLMGIRAAEGDADGEMEGEPEGEAEADSDGDDDGEFDEIPLDSAIRRAQVPEGPNRAAGLVLS